MKGFSVLFFCLCWRRRGKRREERRRKGKERKEERQGKEKGKGKGQDLSIKAQEPFEEMYRLTFMSQSLLFPSFLSCPVVHMNCVMLLHPRERCFSVVLRMPLVQSSGMKRAV